AKDLIHARPADPREALARVHRHDVAVLEQLQHERRAVEGVDLDPPAGAAGIDRRDRELRHAVVDRDDVIDSGLAYQRRLNLCSNPGRPFWNRHVNAAGLAGRAAESQLLLESRTGGPVERAAV